MTRFRIVPERSAVLIDAKSSLHPIRSRTQGLEGYIECDVDGDGRIDLSADVHGALSLRVERLSSGNALEDRELRRRIDARGFPTIDGRIIQMQETARVGRYRVRGEVTLRGVTRVHEDEVELTLTDGDALKIEGASTFDIRDFGMEPPKILMLRVHPEVRVAIDAIAERET